MQIFNEKSFICPEFNIPNIIKFVNTIASNYETVERIFMEYVDNSLDSADDLAHDNGGKYPYTIHINIIIDKIRKTVKFIDNCQGMDIDSLKGVANNIGTSKKAHQNWNNGKFGFGIHTFRACANNITIITQQKEDIIREISFGKNDEKPLGKILKGKYFNNNCGTKVIISNFDKNWWNEVDPYIIKNEIEKHFDQLLAKENLKITIDCENKLLRCKSFDYDKYTGQEFVKDLHQLVEERRGVKTTIPLKNFVKIYLKITNDIIPDKRPVFINKGRRIEEAKDIKSFMNKSKYKTSLWGHNNLVGYIEVNDSVQPTITRDKFINNKERRMLYDCILKLEDEVNNVLVKINKRSESNNLSKLENILSSALSRLAKIDALRFRRQFENNGDINLIETENSDIKLLRKKKGGKGNKKTEQDQNEKIPVLETLDESEMKGKERRTSGFNVKFSDIEQKKIDGTLLRSQFIEGDAIIIYKNHPDFQERIKRTYQGDFKITERLMSYLSTEIAIHYKDKFFESKKKQPEIQNILNIRKESFINLSDFIYELEKILQQYVGKSLITLESSN
jgi:hypothetical protein